MTLHEQRKLLIDEKLQVLKPSKLTIIDESHLHLGHEGAKGGASHFSVVIISPQFAGLSAVQRHQLVYAQLQAYIPHEIHALKIKALTQEEANEQ